MYKNCKLAVIGCGTWGFNHVKTAYKLLGLNLKMVCDVDWTVHAKVKSLSRSIETKTRLDAFLSDAEINCVIVATPSESHYQVAKRCLENGKHVLVEKPMALLSDHVKDLVKIAREQNRILMVGHLLLYHPAIVKSKEIIDEGVIGRLQYIYSNRLNLGKVRSEENILWSFAPHDISVMQYLTESYPIYVDAKGADFLQNNIEDTTFTYLVYPRNLHAHIFVSWLHPFKEHRLTIIGEKGMLVFEDSLKQDKLKLYLNGYHKNNGCLEKFQDHYEIIEYRNVEPLAEEQMHFFDCVSNNEKPLTNGMHALEVLEILERAQKRLRDYDYDYAVRERAPA